MAGVNVKMGVSGVSQFKQSMTQAKNSVKTLDEALKLNEKQFKATGDAQEYTQKKAELLKEKLAEQQKVVEQAEKALETMTRNGVDKASTAFQKMQQQMLRAKSDVLDTSNQIAGIADSADVATAGVEDMSSALNSINTQVSFETVTKGINGITSGLENLGKKAWKVGAQIVQSTLGAGSWADELVTTATAYKELDPSMTPEKLQRMRKTAQIIDTDVETIIGSKNKLAQSMKSKEIDEIFAGFGIQNTRYGEVQDLDDLFWDVGDALMKVENTTKRAQMGQQLFGKQWTQLAPLFTAGREEYEKTMAAQSVVSEDALTRLTDMDDQYQKLQGEIETLRNEFMSELAPAVTTVMGTLTDLVKEFNEYLQTEEGKEAMQAFSEAVTSLFSDITKIDPEKALEGLTGAIDTLKKAFEWITNNKQGVVTALEGIVAGWAAIKLTGGALQIWQLITGLSGLKNGTINLPGLSDSGKGLDPTKTVNTTPVGTTAAAANGAGVNFAAKVATKFGAVGSSPFGQLIGPGILGAMALGDYTAGGREMKNGGSITDALAAEGEAIQKIFSQDNRNAFLDNWNPFSENANFIAKAVGDFVLDNAESMMNLFGGGGGSQPDLSGLKPMATGEYSELLQNLAGQYTRAYVDQESEPFIESVFNNLDDDLGDEFSKLLESVNAGEMVDPAYAMELTDRVRKALEASGIDLTQAATTDGENVSIGLANGINAQADQAIKAAESMAIAVANIMQKALDIGSPSKVMERLGEFVSAGFAQGIEGGFDRVNDAVTGMAGIASGAPVRGGNASGAPGTVSVVLTLDSERLTEVLVPLVNDSMGEELNLIRR